jgi:hypothetical protein
MRQIFIFLLFSTVLAAQPHPAWRHYTLNDGLPDNTVYGLCEDAIGRLYFATNSGICRFDGYKFQRFAGPEEANSAAVFSPQIDDEGRVWFRTMVGMMYFLENDTIRPWKFNYLLEKYENFFLSTSVYFSILKNHVMELQMTGLGFVQIDEQGKMTERFPDNGFKSWVEVPGNLHQLRGIGKGTKIQNQAFAEKNVEMPFIIRDQDLYVDTIYNIPLLKISYRQIGFKLDFRHYLFLASSQICEVENGHPKRTFYYDEKSKRNLMVVFICRASRVISASTFTKIWRL